MNLIHCSFRNTDFYLLNMELKLTMIHSQKLGGGGRLRYRASYRSIDKSVFYVFTCTVYILLQPRPTAFYCNYGSFITRDFGMITVANLNAKRMDSKNCHICDVMGQNQSHVAKHKMAEICILSENVKICPFFVFIKNKIFV